MNQPIKLAIQDHLYGIPAAEVRAVLLRDGWHAVGDARYEWATHYENDVWSLVFPGEPTRVHIPRDQILAVRR